MAYQFAFARSLARAAAMLLGATVVSIAPSDITSAQGVTQFGAGQRLFFRHDGRAEDVVESIQQHASRGSDANGVVHTYNLLPADDRRALVNFLRSLEEGVSRAG